jgi:cobyrinic acid a,c-diamide synthase
LLIDHIFYRSGLKSDFDEVCAMTDCPRVVIAGTHSGAGKTSITLALLSALAHAGKTVQAFKVGPDYIDPSYHTAVTGRHSRNLDAWMLGPDAIKQVFSNAMRGADIGVIEGVMGLFDGLGVSETASTAEMAKRLQAPVLLVIDGHGLSRSSAAMALGYKHFDRKVNVAGVILNNVSGERHAKLLEDAIESRAKIPVLGFLPRDPGIEVPERHLGLVTASEQGPLKGLKEKLGVLALRHFKIDKIVQLARSAPRLGWSSFKNQPGVGGRTSACRIGVAQDAAFNFYYQDNLELLEKMGAELIPFSPLGDRQLPDVDALYFGGGFPEIHAAELEGNAVLRGLLKKKIATGLPVYAECGGLMYLCESLLDGKGKQHKMVNALPGQTEMTPRLQNFGYAQATVCRKTILADRGATIRGHEFHYSRWIHTNGDKNAAYELKKRRTGEVRLEGFASNSIMATYLHIHFLSNPLWAWRFVEAASRRGTS